MSNKSQDTQDKSPQSSPDERRQAIGKERRQAIRRIVRQVEEKLLQDFEADPRTLDEIEQQSHAQTCRQCGKAARSAGRRDRHLVLRSGTHRLRRAYYHCRRCHCGFAPLDEALGQRMQQEWEGRVTQMHRQCLPPSTARPSRLHASMDGVMRHIGGDWHEVKTGCVFETDRSGRAVNARYYASQVASARFGPRLRVLAHEGGMDRCSDVATVADGAAWIWQEFGKYFPRSVQRLDYVHAARH